MSKQILYKAVFLFLLALVSRPAAAQSGITVKATADKNRILIGEQLHLTLEADIPENEAISFFSLDTIPHFEILDMGVLDTSNTSTGTLLSRTIRLTSFDSGHWVIPAFVLGENKTTDSIPVDVGFSSPFDPNQPYHDVKDVRDVEIRKEENNWWWYAVAGGALLLALLLWLLLRKKKPAVQAAEKPADPYDEALRAMNALLESKPDTKSYYSGLVDIFRVFVSRKCGISSLQKTTDDLVLQLRSLSIPKKEFDRLAQALRLSDFVKFAKYKPAEEDDRDILEAIRDSIVIIQQTAGEKTPEGK